MTLPIQRFVQLAVSAALVGLLVWWVDLGEVGAFFRAADPLFLALGLLIAAADRLFMILKWLPLVRAQGLPVPFGLAARVYLASNFASLFLPVSVGPDVVRAVAIGRRYAAVSKVGASIVMERVLGLAGLGLVLSISLPLVIRDTGGLHTYAFLGAGILLVLAFAAVPLVPGVARHMRRWLPRTRGRRILGRITGLWNAYAAYRSHPRLLAGVILASAVEQLAPVALYGATALALGIDIGILPLVVGATLAQLLGRLPVSVSGIGVEEGSAVLFLGIFGLEPSSALSLALGRRALETAVFLPGAAFWRDLGKARIEAEGLHRKDRDAVLSPEIRVQ